ncbi:hypothetical protein GGR21_001114 [Dysgonomonas hofstadii]|uniref:Uncharacterized protein n=1 Tax=Dysgonomonas hofstadii TaxID=637886 RepID=A0A840CQM3_9BACT|nr:hypothetical protein [Dysgonomonas hofstadii]MBB4035225.1 hypothetical protein [Dysgonomonas hofstadii]
MKVVEISIHNSENEASTVISVEHISSNIFRTIQNEIIDGRLTLDTVFETKINTEKKHEVVRIIKQSEYITKRFQLTSQFKESEYQLLGEEITKSGGYWQVDFGKIATINLPKDCNLDINEIFETFDFKPIEI